MVCVLGALLHHEASETPLPGCASCPSSSDLCREEHKPECFSESRISCERYVERRNLAQGASHQVKLSMSCLRRRSFSDCLIPDSSRVLNAPASCPLLRTRPSKSGGAGSAYNHTVSSEGNIFALRVARATRACGEHALQSPFSQGNNKMYTDMCT